MFKEVTGKQIGIGAAALLLLSTAAGAVANMKTLGIDGLLPVTRDYVQQVAGNLSDQQQEDNRRWLEFYQDKYLEVELQQQQQMKETSDVNGTLRLFEARKRTIKNQIELLQKKAE